MINNEDLQVVQIGAFDGSVLWSINNTKLYEVGNFLGGGAAGTVYEALQKSTSKHYALKILNPLGFKLMAPATLRRCAVVSRGLPFDDTNKNINNSSSPITPMQTLSKENLWWLISGSGNNQHYVAAYQSVRQNELRELSLAQCMIIWNTEMKAFDANDGYSSNSNDKNTNNNTNSNSIPSNLEDWVEHAIGVDGTEVIRPAIPKKFADYLRKRSRILREMRNMQKISDHPNIISFYEVLELTQESKSTLFVVLELANGGELFDRIKIDYGTREDTAKKFFRQLVDGVFHCHNKGVCHRDLKPENLLLTDVPGKDTLLKIADFGFSTRFIASLQDNNTTNNSSNSMVSASPGTIFNNLSGMELEGEMNDLNMNMNSTDNKPNTNDNGPIEIRTLTSVVGSPFYVAPEVLQAKGYSGPKADVWSLGVILYAMLAGNLPFGEELGSCKRFRYFCQWIRDATAKGAKFWDDENLDYPVWLFPPKFSKSAKGLIVAMLHPDPRLRISVDDALLHPWCPKFGYDQEEPMDSNTNNVEGMSRPMSHDHISADMASTDDMDASSTPVNDGDDDTSGQAFAMDGSDDNDGTDKERTNSTSSNSKGSVEQFAPSSTTATEQHEISSNMKVDVNTTNNKTTPEATSAATAAVINSMSNVINNANQISQMNLTPEKRLLFEKQQEQLLQLQLQQQQLLQDNPGLLEHHLQEQQKHLSTLLHQQQTSSQSQPVSVTPTPSGSTGPAASAPRPRSNLFIQRNQVQQQQVQQQHQFVHIGQQGKRPSFADAASPPPTMPAVLASSIDTMNTADLLNPEVDSQELEEIFSPEPLPPGAVPMPGVVYADNQVHNSNTAGIHSQFASLSSNNNSNLVNNTNTNNSNSSNIPGTPNSMSDMPHAILPMFLQWPLP